MITQEEKELLLKDISGRLPYGQIVQISLFRNDGIKRDIDLDPHVTENIWELIDKYHALPYLRPMSSMTGEEFTKLKEYSGLKYDQLDLASFQNGAYKILDFYLSEVPSGAVIRVFDWLNKYHFDYRDLIQMGLAIAVTKENNPYKT